jgi:AcrR family transcriptional regulator
MLVSLWHDRVMSAEQTRSLREQQAQLTRELILRAVAELLEGDDPDEISVPEVARHAGVSLRTVYRYFPTREELFAAAGEWIGEHLFGDAPFEQTADELGEVFKRVCERFDESPRLVRAMALSQAGRSVRSQRRGRRLASIRNALAEVTDRLPKQEAREAEAVFFYLESMLAWVTMRDEAGLNGKQTGEAIAWAIRTLVADLRRRNEAAGANHRRTT